MKRLCWIAAMAIASTLLPTQAAAVIGSPRISRSVAGVARRTVRRKIVAAASMAAPRTVSHQAVVSTRQPGS